MFPICWAYLFLTTYLAIIYEVTGAVGCILAYICKNVVYISMYHIGCLINMCNVAAIFFVMHVKYVHHAPCCMVHASDFISGTGVHMHISYKAIKFLVYIIHKM